MEPDRDYTYPVAVRNDGNVDTFADGYDDWTWPNSGGHPVNLGCRWYDRDDHFVPVAVDRRTPLPASLPPGDAVTVVAAVRTPAALGRYTLKCDLVHEGIFWFEDTGDVPLTLSVVVTDEIWTHYLPLVIKS